MRGKNFRSISRSLDDIFESLVTGFDVQSTISTLEPFILVNRALLNLIFSLILHVVGGIEQEYLCPRLFSPMYNAMTVKRLVCTQGVSSSDLQQPHLGLPTGKGKLIGTILMKDKRISFYPSLTPQRRISVGKYPEDKDIPGNLSWG